MGNKLAIEIVVNLLSLLVVVLVTAVELPLVHESGQAWYLGLRVIPAVGFLGLIHLRRHFDKVWYGILWCSFFYFYCFVGEYFRPLYIIALVQIQILHATYFRHSRFSFPAVHISGSLIFLGILAYAWEENLQRLSISTVQDQATIAFCSIVTALLVHSRIEKAKAKSEKMTKKLALVGSYATSLIHDLKNLNSSPLIYSEMLADKEKKLSPEQVSEVAGLLNADLKKIQYLVRELYDSSRVHETLLEICSLEEAVQIAREVVGPRLGPIELSISGSGTVKTDRRVLQVILLNLFYNSIAALQPFSDRKRRIEVVIGKDNLDFASNSLSHQSDDAPPGLGRYLMEELARHTNIQIEQNARGDKWITSLYFR